MIPSSTHCLDDRRSAVAIWFWIGWAQRLRHFTARQPQRSDRLTSSRRLEADGLSTMPHHPPTQLGQLLPALDDGHDVVSAERSGLAAENGSAVRDQDLGLADPVGMEKDLTRRRALRVVLGADANIEAA